MFVIKSSAVLSTALLFITNIQAYLMPAGVAKYGGHALGVENPLEGGGRSHGFTGTSDYSLAVLSVVCGVGKFLQNGKYILEQELGRGGFGVTYKAINAVLGQTVVVKTLNESLQQDPKFATSQRHFQDEARRLARFAHPHIVRVNDFFIEEGLPYIVMDYIPGQTLDTLVLPDRPLPEAIALHYIRQVSAAVQVIHQNGLLHRDIKPQNLILQQGTQHVILIDFGIAREFTPGLTQTHTHLVSAGYAPIEQYLPQARRSPATDIYGLAATLYTLLTAQVPVAAALRDRIPMASPRELRPELSARVDTGVMRGMAMEPHQRPASVDEWLALLPEVATQPAAMAIASGRPISQVATLAVARAHQPSETEPAPRAATPLAQPRGVRPWHIGLLGLAAIVPFGLGYALLNAQPQSDSPTLQSPTPTPTLATPSPLPAAEPTGGVEEAESSTPVPAPPDESPAVAPKDLSPEDFVPPSEPAVASPTEEVAPTATESSPEASASPPDAETAPQVNEPSREEERQAEERAREEERRVEERAREEERRAEEQEREQERAQERGRDGDKVKH